MSDANGRESELILFLTGKTRDEVMGGFTVPELIRLSGMIVFMNSLPI